MIAQPPVQILISGAGAAGLTLAIDLARRGVSVRLIDKLAAPFAGSRGKGIQPRTLEVFEDLGIVDRLAAVGSPYPLQRMYRPDGSYHDAQDVVIAAPTAQEPYRTPLMVPQFRTEAVMRERLAEFGIAPEYGSTLQSFEQDADGVTAHIIGVGGAETIRCKYLIGGDGGRSFVRDTLGIGFPGKTMGVRAMVADLRLDGLSRDVWHRFNEGDMARQISFCPLPHTDQFQLQAPIPLDGDADLTLAGVQSFIDARLPEARIVVRNITWASAYSMNARLADRYRVGRIFLIGDAAHIHPPTGGQGLNTSVQDAYNLGWKLGAVLGGAPDALLDTYEEERRPIAASMLGLSTTLLEKAKSGDMRRGREVHQLDLGYPWSSLSEGGGIVGNRAPDGILQGAGGQPKRLFDLLSGPQWTAITRGSVDAFPSTARDGLKVVRIGPDEEFHDTGDALGQHYGISDKHVLLIRPDGYVGAVFAGTDTDRITEYLAKT